MPTGQGSAKQHTPQPVQAAPHAGLGGAEAWMRIVRVMSRRYWPAGQWRDRRNYGANTAHSSAS